MKSGAKPAGKTKSSGSTAVQAYDSLVAAALPEVERKGDNNPYTSLNGNMFTLLHQSKSLAIRLPEAAREEFIKKHKTTLFSAYGTVMKEYVAVPDSLLSNTREMKKYLQLSYGYAQTLKPKSTNPKAAKSKGKTTTAGAENRKSAKRSKRA
jgi:TfoX/Sxy family transcriptional regulator of competence genes